MVDAVARPLPSAGVARLIALPLRCAPHHETSSGGGVQAGPGALAGVNVLVVEDDFIVAFDMQTLLEEHGARVIGPAATLEEARALIGTGAVPVHVAVLDVNLNGQFVFPVAVDLQRAAVPFAFATAYADDDHLFPGELQSVPRLAKPVLPNALIGQLQRLLMRDPARR